MRPGAIADLIIVEGDPLDDIRNTNTIQMVMKNGRLIGTVEAASTTRDAVVRMITFGQRH